MRRKVQVITPVTTKSPMGAPQKSFAHLCFMLTSRKEAGESPENYVNNRLVRAPRYKYRTHYFAAIDETMRIVDGGIQYNILSVDADPEDSLFIEIVAEKIVE